MPICFDLFVERIKVSNNSNFPEGTLVLAYTGWRTHSLVSNTEENTFLGPVVKSLPDFGELSPSLAIGCLGMPGWVRIYVCFCVLFVCELGMLELTSYQGMTIIWFKIWLYELGWRQDYHHEAHTFRPYFIVSTYLDWQLISDCWSEVKSRPARRCWSAQQQELWAVWLDRSPRSKSVLHILLSVFFCLQQTP